MISCWLAALRAEQVDALLPLRGRDDLESSDADTLTLLVILALYFFEADYAPLVSDPLVRLLLKEPSYKLDFTIVSAMGVITEGIMGLELNNSFRRIYEERGVVAIR